MLALPRLPTSLASFDQYSYDEPRDANDSVDNAALVQLTEQRLYTLSRFGWLSVIDLTEPDHLRLLGQAKVKASPFQLHVLGSTALGLFNDCKDYQEDAQSRGCVVAFDVSAPSAPIVMGAYPVHGTIAGARLTGHILYVVANDAESSTTRVVAIDVGGAPNALLEVDERRYPNASGIAGGWVAGVRITEQHIYVATPRLGDGVPVGSTINVVGISASDGMLVDVAAFEAVGRIEHAWQMDEAGGVLRLVSLALEREPTYLQTFTVSAAQPPAPLARLDVEFVGSHSANVLFDGPRAYALSYWKGYSLATLDLTDPANPKYAGTIGLNGKPLQIVPRGERLVTLSAEDRLSSRFEISLFDVSELSMPRLLAEAKLDEGLASNSFGEASPFGSVQLFEAEHLIAIPYAFPLGDRSSVYCSNTPPIGVQLIDWTDGALAPRGTANAIGLVQRVALRDGRLFVVSNLSAAVFDTASSQMPRLKSTLKLTETATRLVDAGHSLARVSVDGTMNSVRIETSSSDDIERREPSGSIELNLSITSCEKEWNLENVLAGNDRIHVLMSESDSTRRSIDPPRETRIVTIDVANAAEPRVIDESTFRLGIGWQYYFDYRVPNAGQMTALVGNALVAMGREPLSQDFRDRELRVRNSLHVFDVSRSKPQLVRTIPLPAGRGTTGLLATGTSILVSRYAEVPTNAERFRFYLDRLDVSEPAAPLLYPPVSMPGATVAFEQVSGRAITLDYLDAYGGPVIHLVDTGPPSLDSAIILGSTQLESNQDVFSVEQGDNRVFALARMPTRTWLSDTDCQYNPDCVVPPTEQPLIVIGGFRTGRFETGRITIDAQLLTVSGPSAIVAVGPSLLVVDAADVSAPRIVDELDALGTPSLLTSAHGMAIALSRDGGVRSFPLPK